jgi:YD repeat-containing protein
LNPATYRAESATDAQTGVWTHLVGVFDSSNGAMTLYVNGVAAGNVTDTSPLASGGPLVIGHGYFNGAAGNYVTGQITSVQAYARALSAAEVSTVYGGGRSGGTVASSPANTTSWVLDKRGLPTSQTDPNGNVTSFSYDEAGQAAVTTAPTVNAETGGGTPAPVHPVSTTGFNTFGDPVEKQDPNGNETLAVYDAEGQTVSVTLPNYVQPGTTTPITATVVSTYDKLGKLVARTDPANNTTRYLYDQLGNLVQTTAPSGATTVASYDTNGDKLSETDPVGAQHQATYDFLGRPLTATSLERFPSAVTATSTNSYAASVSNPGGAFLASTTTPNGTVTGYGYDHIGQTTSVTDGAGNVTRYTYNLLGDKQVTTLPDNTTSTVSYDALGNPIQVQQKNAIGALLTQTSATYDAVGHVLSSTDARSNTSTFTYDATGKITQEVQPVSATSSITASFGYDAAGNRTRFTDGRGNPTIYTFTSWNKQESLIEPATATYTTAADRTFTTIYDANGRPASQVQPGG